MPASCGIVGCTNSGKNSKVGFFQIPKVMSHQGKATEELLKRRRAAWIKAINRKGYTDEVLKTKPWFKVCGDHFISGKPAYVQFENSPDWVPSLKLGYSKNSPSVPNVSTRKKSKKQLATDSDVSDYDGEADDVSTEKKRNQSTSFSPPEPIGSLLMSAEPAEEETKDSRSHPLKEPGNLWFSSNEETSEQDSWSLSSPQPQVIRSLLSGETFTLAKKKPRPKTAGKSKASGQKGKTKRHSWTHVSFDTNFVRDPATNASAIKPVMMVRTEDIDELQKAARKPEKNGLAKRNKRNPVSPNTTPPPGSPVVGDPGVWPVMVLKAEDIDELEDEIGTVDDTSFPEVVEISVPKQDFIQEKMQSLVQEKQDFVHKKKRAVVQEEPSLDKPTSLSLQEKKSLDTQAFELKQGLDTQAFELKKQSLDEQAITQESQRLDKPANDQETQACDEEMKLVDQSADPGIQLKKRSPVSDVAVSADQLESPKSKHPMKEKSKKRKKPSAGPSTKLQKPSSSLYEFTLISQTKPASEESTDGSENKNVAIIRPALKYRVDELNKSTGLSLLFPNQTAKDQKLQTSVEILKCFTCQQDFLTLDSFGNHTCPNMEEENFSCLLCSKNIGRDEFQDHMVTHMQDQLVPHKCDICGLRFPDAKNLADHRLLDHSYQCDICSMKFSKESMIEQHKLYHHASRCRPKRTTFVCKVCKQEFEKYSTLCTHMNQHEELIKVFCGICGRGFAYVSQLTRHLKLHRTKERNYQCEECGQTFHHSHVLRKHQFRHKGIKPYTCEICGKKLASREGYTSHVMAHQGPPPFKCDLCDKGYYTSFNLKNHKKDKHKTSEVGASQNLTAPAE